MSDDYEMTNKRIIGVRAGGEGLGLCSLPKSSNAIYFGTQFDRYVRNVFYFIYLLLKRMCITKYIYFYVPVRYFGVERYAVIFS